eukprot:1399892-Rhodomonas_salina.1
MEQELLRHAACALRLPQAGRRRQLRRREHSSLDAGAVPHDDVDGGARTDGCCTRSKRRTHASEHPGRLVISRRRLISRRGPPRATLMGSTETWKGGKPLADDAGTSWHRSTEVEAEEEKEEGGEEEGGAGGGGMGDGGGREIGGCLLYTSPSPRDRG